MNAKWICAAVVAAVLPLSVGCSSSPVVRGQSPAMPIGSSYEMSGAMMSQGQACPGCPGGCPGCQPGSHHGHRTGIALKPEHWMKMEYKVPKHLSYPQENFPAPVVQYPYYTHKGPSDFFMK